VTTHEVEVSVVETHDVSVCDVCGLAGDEDDPLEEFSELTGSVRVQNALYGPDSLIRHDGVERAHFRGERTLHLHDDCYRDFVGEAPVEEPPTRREVYDDATAIPVWVVFDPFDTIVYTVGVVLLTLSGEWAVSVSFALGPWVLVALVGAAAILISVWFGRHAEAVVSRD
jgi:hypothetical protein